MDNSLESKSTKLEISSDFQAQGNSEEKLWNRNFSLLFQGQAVSILGDNVFDLALRFWILAKTGSVSLMGALLAVATIPKVFISPFAGTFVDRHDRRRVLITADIISGITILIIGIGAITDFLQVWMIFISSIIVGICGCFFNPTINSCIPDIVPSSKLLKANSVLSSISSANDMVGFALGGFLIQLVGAPVLFIFNGFSFLFSATSALFAKIPPVKATFVKLNFMEDMKAGMRFVKSQKGLTYLFTTNSFLNFFASMSMTLTLPWFKINEQLGMGFYGISMAINTSGILLGYALLSLIEIRKEKKFSAFIISGIVISITMIIYSMTLNFYIISIMFFIDGLSLAVIGSLMQTSMQNCVPSNMRSKVFAFRNTLSSALMPTGMMLAGILGERINMNIIIFADYVLFLMLFIYLSFLKSVKKVINI